MSLRSEVETVWEDWKTGAAALVYAAIGAALAFILSAIALITFHEIFGGKASSDEMLNWALIVGVVLVPLLLDWGIKAIAEYEEDLRR